MDSDTVVTDYSLKIGQELRVEVSSGKDVLITLKEGSAEVFGTELATGGRVNISGQKLAVNTWSTCKLQVEGSPDVIYTAEETPMAMYLNLHDVLQQRRIAAQQNGTPGPRCIILGPTDSGKSTLCRMLCNWAVRSGQEVTVVDLDVGQGTITCPGCLAATPVEVPVSIEEGFLVEIPLVFYYGHSSPNDNPELYKFLVDRMASVLQRRAQSSSTANSAGLVINTLGWIEGLGYELQVHAIQSFKADVVVVIEQDRLHSQLSAQAEVKGLGASVVKLPKSGGVVTRPRDERKEARDRRVREYFYGVQRTLMPATQTVGVRELKVFRIGGGPRAPNSALPIGAVSMADPLRIVELPVTPDLVQSLLAVSHAASEDQLLTSNTAGFVFITDVDTALSTVTFLAPCPGPLPGRYLLAGSLKSFFE